MEGMEKAAVVKSEVKRCGKGERCDIEGIPFIKLQGTPYEMGLQYGTLLKEELKEVFQRIDRLKDSFFSTLPGFILPLVNLILRIKLWVLSYRLPKSYKQEMRGIAVGSGFAYNDVLYMGLFLEITTSSLASVADLLAEADCSSILIKRGKEIIHGRNFDFLPLFLGDFTALVEYNPQDRHSYTSLGIIGYPGVFTGMNEAGLSISLNISVGYRRRFREIPISYKLRELLSTCLTIQDVDDALKDYQVEVGMILSVGSKTEELGVIYDLTVSGIKKNEMGDQGHLYVCNRYLDSELTSLETPIIYGLSYLNIAREDKIREYLEVRGVNTIDDMIKLLGDADYYDYKNILGTHNGTVNNERTLHSVVMDLFNGEIYFTATHGFAGWSQYLRYNLQTKESTIYREILPKLQDLELDKYLHWYNDILFYYVKKDYQSIAKKVMEFNELNRAQLLMLDAGWEEIKELIDLEGFFAILDKSIQKYPDFGFLFKYKGKFLLALNRVDEALSALHTALEANMVFVSEEMESLSLLAKAYHNKGEKLAAQTFARKVLELIDRNRDQFALGKTELKLQNEMKHLLR